MARHATPTSFGWPSREPEPRPSRRNLFARTQRGRSSRPLSRPAMPAGPRSLRRARPPSGPRTALLPRRPPRLPDPQPIPARPSSQAHDPRATVFPSSARSPVTTGWAIPRTSPMRCRVTPTLTGPAAIPPGSTSVATSRSPQAASAQAPASVGSPAESQPLIPADITHHVAVAHLLGPARRVGRLPSRGGGSRIVYVRAAAGLRRRRTSPAVSFRGSQRVRSAKVWEVLPPCASRRGPLTPGGRASLRLGERPSGLGRRSVRLGEPAPELGETPLPLGETPRRLGQSPLALGRRRPEIGETPRQLGETLPAHRGAAACALEDLRQGHQRQEKSGIGTLFHASVVPGLPLRRFPRSRLPSGPSCIRAP